jgi:replicative DNA helicase
MKETAFHGVHDAGEYITNGSLFVYDKPSARVIDIRQKARRLRQREGIEILVIDYVGMVKADDMRLDKRLQIDSISKAVKELAMELNIPVLLLAQMNRLSEGQKPTLSQLKESGSLEEDADVVILLHRDRDDDSSVQEVDVNVAKNRNGPTGRCTMGLQKSYMKFVNMEVAR